MQPARRHRGQAERRRSGQGRLAPNPAPMHIMQAAARIERDAHHGGTSTEPSPCHSRQRRGGSGRCRKLGSCGLGARQLCFRHWCGLLRRRLGLGLFWRAQRIEWHLLHGKAAAQSLSRLSSRTKLHLCRCRAATLPIHLPGARCQGLPSIARRPYSQSLSTPRQPASPTWMVSAGSCISR